MVSLRPCLGGRYNFPHLIPMDINRDHIEALKRRFKSGVGELVNRALNRSVKLAVTGLNESGKTVFITALLHHLSQGSQLPFFKAVRDGRLAGVKIIPRAESDLPEFRYKEFIEKLTADAPLWPEPTDRISEIRLAIRYRPGALLRRQLTPLSTLYLDIIDYPGEWLLDLTLLDKTFEDWSRLVLGLCEYEPRASLAREWLDFINNLDLSRPAEEGTMQQAAALYTTFLERCKAAGLTLLQPGRFTMPGDLKGAPLLGFCPLPWLVAPPPNSFYAMMVQRYEAYKERVVRRFYREQFAHFDRQIVLVDLFRILNQGYERFHDMRETLALLLESFSYGRAGLIHRLFRPRIDKVLFAATKADHVAANQHHNLRLLLEQLITEAAKEVRFSGVEMEPMTLASVKATETVITDYEGGKLSCVKGIPADREREVLLFPGEIPETIPTAADWIEDRFRFLSFRPPPFSESSARTLPHIRLDQALEFLLGDKLA
jgi:uncharacterized protein